MPQKVHLSFGDPTATCIIHRKQGQTALPTVVFKQEPLEPLSKDFNRREDLLHGEKAHKVPLNQ